MLDFPVERDPQIMGIVNVTPDSFSDGGRFDAHASAIAQGRRLAAEGAHIVDVGGESTRPGAESIPVGNEIERVVPVVSALSDDGIAVSVDTSKPEVMEAAVAAGACMVNDIYALQRPGALEMAAQFRSGLPDAYAGDARNYAEGSSLRQPSEGDHRVSEVANRRLRQCRDRPEPSTRRSRIRVR
jgi:dihydropteroate synthase